MSPRWPSREAETLFAGPRARVGRVLFAGMDAHVVSSRRMRKMKAFGAEVPMEKKGRQELWKEGEGSA